MIRILARLWIWLIITAGITLLGTVIILLLLAAIHGEPTAQAACKFMGGCLAIAAFAIITVWSINHYAA